MAPHWFQKSHHLSLGFRILCGVAPHGLSNLPFYCGHLFPISSHDVVVMSTPCVSPTPHFCPDCSFHLDCSFSPLSNYQNLPFPSSGFTLHLKSVKTSLISTQQSLSGIMAYTFFSPLSGCGLPEDSDHILIIFMSSEASSVHASKMKKIAGQGATTHGMLQGYA